MSDETQAIILRTLERMEDRLELVIVKVAKIEERVSWRPKVTQAVVALAVTAAAVIWKVVE